MEDVEEPPRYLFCRKCGMRRIIAVDKNLSANSIVCVLKWCLEKKIPFMPVDFSTPSWKNLIKRVPHCIRLQFASRSMLSKDDRHFATCEVKGDNPVRDECKELSSHDDIMYIVTTSGTSKPVPKVVYVTRASVESNISDFRSKFSITGNSVLYCSSPLTFDPAILTALLAIRTGAKLIMYNDMAGNPIQLLKLLKENKVTHIQTVPSFLRLIQLPHIASHLLTSDTCVQVIGMGGEPCLTGEELSIMFSSVEVVRKVKVFNLYGLTEQSVWSAMHEIEPEYIISKSSAPVPIGDPLTHTEFVFKPASFQETDIESVEGASELVLRSKERVCYIDDGQELLVNSPELATGDLLTKDLLFLGRKQLDFVKVGATRISLISLSQEVEGHTGVQQAHCYHQPSIGLVIVYTGNATPTEVESFLQAPDMCPGNVTAMKVEKLEVNSHGKLDRKWLKELIDKRLKEKISKTLDIIKNYLPGDLVMHKTFTENGGSSIQALALSSHLSMMTSQSSHVVIEDVLNRSIRDLCTLIERGKRMRKGTNIDLQYRSTIAITAKRYKVGGASMRSRDTVTLSRHVGVLKVMWTVDMGKCVDATPTIVVSSHGDMILIGSHSHKLMCINTLDGGVVWTAELAGRIEARAAVDAQHNRAYVGCYDKNLYCINLTNGCVQHKQLCDDVIKATPAIDMETNNVYFGSHDHYVYCLCGESLKCQWKKALDGAVYASPILDKGSLYIATLSGNIYSIDKVSGDIIDVVSQGAPIFSTPALTDSRITVCSVDGLCVSRDRSCLSSVIWSFKAAGNIYSTPAVVDDCLVFGCHDNNVYCVNASSGEMKWSTQCDSAVSSTPFPYKVNGSKKILITSTHGFVYTITMGTGHSSCLHRLPGDVFGSPLLVGEVRDKLVIGCRDDKVYCLDFNQHTGSCSK